MTEEKIIIPANGYLMLFLFLILLFGSIALIPITETGWSVFGIIAALVLAFGFLMVQPNGSRVLLLFGKYVIKQLLTWIIMKTLYACKQMLL